MVEGRLVSYVIKASGGSDDYFERVVLVMMRWERMKSRSRAAWMSPMKMERPCWGWV